MQDGRTIGRDGFKIEIPELRSAFPDLSIEADEWIMAPGKVIARVTWRGTHTGKGWGSSRAARNSRRRLFTSTGSRATG